ncbi:MAG: hypothetical protein K2V38_26030, partial [Gemmataceae bacterium]|nr:hypothetical protein [Gemmataceae bacterium]
MLWSRKPAPVHDRARAVGLDLTASRALAEASGSRALLLDPPDHELPLFIAGDRRTPEVGRAGVGIARKNPHLVCSNFLPALGQAKEWKLGRHALVAEAALGLVFDKVRGPVLAESDAVGLALPAYLSPSQVTRVGFVAERSKLPLAGTASAALALVADRAFELLATRPAAPKDKESGG